MANDKFSRQDNINPFTGEPLEGKPPSAVTLTQSDAKQVKGIIAGILAETETELGGFYEELEKELSYPAPHYGRPGEQGGSRPRPAGEGADPGKVRLAGKVTAQELIGQLEAGGFSIAVDGKSPETGYMVALSKDSEKVIPLNELRDNPALLVSFVSNSAEYLSRPDVYLGGWVEGDKAYLDVSWNAPSLDSAVRQGLSTSQIAVYDIKAGQSVYLDHETRKPFVWVNAAGEVVGSDSPDKTKKYLNP